MIRAGWLHFLADLHSLKAGVNIDIVPPKARAGGNIGFERYIMRQTNWKRTHLERCARGQ
jgi:hypothetical protein